MHAYLAIIGIAAIYGCLVWSTPYLERRQSPQRRKRTSHIPALVAHGTRVIRPLKLPSTYG